MPTLARSRAERLRFICELARSNDVEMKPCASNIWECAKIDMRLDICVSVSVLQYAVLFGRHHVCVILVKKKQTPVAPQ